MTADEYPRRDDVIVLAIAALVMLGSVLMTPSPSALSFFGFEIPVVCTWRRLIGAGCPGCGLTRSFAFMADGMFYEAWSMNKLGPPLFVVFAAQLPYRLIRILRKRPPAE